MSDHLVTITLGRSGRVVQRSGTKQFVGSDRILSVKKRLRVDHARWRPGDNGFKGFWISQNDLRVKLMRKRHIERKKRYLREKLPEVAQIPAHATMIRHKLQLKGSSHLRQYPSTEVLDDMLPENAFRGYYPFPAIDGSRIRSPDDAWAAKRGLSPPRNLDVRQQLPDIRATGVSRGEWVFSREVGNASRPTTLTAYRATAETGKPITFTSGIMLKSSDMCVESPNISGLLHSLGLRKYAVNFKAEEVDMATLKQMGDEDLKELGLPLGPRKKILLALQPRSKQLR